MTSPSPYAPPGVDPTPLGENQLTVAIPGVSKRLAVEHPGLFSGRRLLIDGQPAEKAGLGKVRIPADSGEVLVARFQEALTGPVLVIGKQKYLIGPRVPAALTILVYLSLGLVGAGGLIGGLFGGAAWGINRAILLSRCGTGLKVLLILLVLVGATVATLVAAGALQFALQR